MKDFITKFIQFKFNFQNHEIEKNYKFGTIWYLMGHGYSEILS